MQKLKNTLEAIEDWTAGLLIVGGLAVIFIGVIMRYIFNDPISFVEEYSNYLIIWGTMFGAVVALRDNGHIRVDMVYRLFPPKMQKGIDIFANLAGLTFALFLFVYGTQGIFLDQYSVYQMGLVSTGEGVSLWKVYMVMPFIGLLLAIRFIIRLIRVMQNKPESDTDEESIDNGGVNAS